MFRLTSGIIDRDICYHNGYRKGQKDFAEKVKAEILALNDDYCSTQEVLDIIENIGKEVIDGRCIEG